MKNRPISTIFKEIKGKLKDYSFEDRGTYVQWGALKIDKYIWDKFLGDEKIQKEIKRLIK